MRIHCEDGGSCGCFECAIGLCSGGDSRRPMTLKDAYKGDFVIGVAMNDAQITGEDQSGDALIESQFNSISPENALKWIVVHPAA